MKYTVFDSLHNPQGALNSSTWAELAKLMQDVPTYPSKSSQPLIKLGVFEGDSRGAGHSLTTVSGVELDYDAGEVTTSSAAKLLRQAGIECVVCSTYTSSMDRQKWRIFAPTSRELPAELRIHLVTALDGVLGNIAARESFTPKQTFFIGRNPDSNYIYFHVRGEFLDVALKGAANAAYKADKRAKAERENLAATACIRTETQRNRKAAGRLVEGQVSPIAAFNDAHDVRSILTAHGYRPKGSKYLSPQSSSGIAGVVILQGQDGITRAYSHGTSDVLADGKAHDAFDLFCILAHSGDEWAAIQEAARLMTTSTGVTLQAHNQMAYRKNRANDRTRALLQGVAK